MQGLLIKLCLAILEKLIVEGSKSWVKYVALKNELEENEKKARKYKEVVDGNKKREDRQKAEDDLLS